MKVFFTFFEVDGAVSLVLTVSNMSSLGRYHVWAYDTCCCYALVEEEHRLGVRFLHFACLADSMFKGKCAECNAHWNSKAFKSRPAGYDIPVADERRLSFAFESASNNKLCG